MKNRNRILLGLRMAAAGTFVLMATGLAFIAVQTTGAPTNNKLSPAWGNQHFQSVKQEATYGLEARAEMALKDPQGALEAGLPDFGPATAAVEESFKRSYPGTSGIPISATQQAYADSVAFVTVAMTPPTPAPTATPPATATPGKGGKKGGKGGKKGKPTPTPVKVVP